MLDGCWKKRFDSDLKRCFNEENALTLLLWLSETSARTVKPALARCPILFEILSHNYWPLNVTSGIAWTTKGIEVFSPTTMNAMIPFSHKNSLFSVWQCFYEVSVKPQPRCSYKRGSTKEMCILWIWQVCLLLTIDLYFSGWAKKNILL